MKNTVIFGIVVLLLTIIFLQRSCTPSVEKLNTDTLVVTKIVYVTVHDTIYKTPKVVTRILPGKVLPPKYLPDTNYIALKKQYQQLVIEHLAKNIYEDKLNLDTLGNIVIRDTTQFNKLGKRSYQVNLRIPKRVDSVFITNTISPPLKRQVYLGVGATSTQTANILGLRGSILYKDKKDNMFSPNVTITTNGVITYGVDTYFKIKLKK